MFDIPPDLDAIPAGDDLAAALSAVDLDRTSGHDLVVVLRAAQRMASHFQAQVYTAMAAISDHMERVEFAGDLEVAWDAAATEVRAALRLTRRAAESDLCLAIDLRHRLPRVRGALRRGDIDPRRARVFVDETRHVAEDHARRVADELLRIAPGLTTGQLRARLRRLCIELDPDTADTRYEETVDQRRVVLDPSSDGTADLVGLDLPPDRATAAKQRIHRLALSLRAGGDRRTMDQLRADVFLDLLAGKRDAGRGGVVDLHVDLETLARLEDHPGDLGGYGPVIADIARQVADAQVDGEWRFTISDPSTGLPVHDGTTRRRPTAAQRRTVEARDRTCIFPGCRMPARNCDLDHRTPWSQSHQTETSGLDAACRYDHITVRHRLGWIHIPLPGGDHLWISPLGHRYRTSGRSP